jgi:hypothetical protein
MLFFCSWFLPRWYKMEFIAVKKKSETISTLPFRFISVFDSLVWFAMVLGDEVRLSRVCRFVFLVFYTTGEIV